MIIARRITSILFTKQYENNGKKIQQRDLQVSIIGAASDIGSNLSFLLKQNPKINRLQLYDDDERLIGMGLELEHIPGGPTVSTFTGTSSLPAAVRSSELVVMVSRIPRYSNLKRVEMLAANAPAVYTACRAVAEQNPDTFFAISTNPINSLIPFASAVLMKYECYNPYKLFGITHIDTARSRTLAGNILEVDPQQLQVPVIGGHSIDTIIPLFSNLSPSCYCVDSCQADTLTRLVKKAGIEIIKQKAGKEAATLAMAWSINEFVEIVINALLGEEAIVHCFTANSHFGTRFFAGPNRVGADGIIQTCCSFSMSNYESSLLNIAVPIINSDVIQGEGYVRILEYAGRKH